MVLRLSFVKGPVAIFCDCYAENIDVEEEKGNGEVCVVGTAVHVTKKIREHFFTLVGN